MLDGIASGQGLCVAVPNPCLFYGIKVTIVIVNINLTYLEMFCSMLLKRTGTQHDCTTREISDRISNKTQPFYEFIHYLL